MVAMVKSPFVARAAPIAASMAILGPGSDRPAAFRPAAPAKDGDKPAFLSPARNAASFGRGKKQAQPLREGDRGVGRPSGLISPFEVALDASHERTDGENYGDRHQRSSRTWARSIERMLTRAHQWQERRASANASEPSRISACRGDG